MSIWYVNNSKTCSPLVEVQSSLSYISFSFILWCHSQFVCDFKYVVIYILESYLFVLSTTDCCHLHLVSLIEVIYFLLSFTVCCHLYFVFFFLSCCHLYFVVIFLLLSFISCCHLYFVVIFLLFSFISCCHLYFVVIFLLFLFISCCSFPVCWGSWCYETTEGWISQVQVYRSDCQPSSSTRYV